MTGKGGVDLKILVLGANGMAGHTISLYMAEQGHEVVGFARTKSKCCHNSIVGDAQDSALLRTVIKEGRFDAVINCIGVLNQFAQSDQAAAVYLNSYLPHFLAQVTEAMQTQVVHMSTDCVFSGRTGSYAEDAFRDGETFYDRTKALGELDDQKNVTLRNSIVGPDINEQGIGLLNWFMLQQGALKGYTHAMWTGQTTLQLAKTMEAAIRQRVSGIYNMVPDRAISKYELLQLFNRFLRGGKLSIKPFDDFVCDKSLVRTRFDFHYDIPDYEEMVADMAAFMRKHAVLYPHYAL